MGLFGSKREGGIMDVIRCDLDDYIVWKWSPNGEASKKENAIRYGSSLRVKDGEVAAFIYRQHKDKEPDFIEGPHDQTIKSSNFPILTSIVGSAFGGNSPFQAEIYFINLSDTIRIPFFFNDFSLCDARYPDFSVPASVKGSFIMQIEDYKTFTKKYRMRNIDKEDFWAIIKDQAAEKIKSSVISSAKYTGMELTNIQGALSALSTSVKNMLVPEFSEIFHFTLRSFSISNIILNEDHADYKALKAATAGRASKINEMETNVAMQNMADNQSIMAENLRESQRIMREETQRQQKLQSESNFLAAHQINVQGDVARTAAESLGQMGGGMSFGDGGGMNPAGMMAGMMMGGAVAGNMSNMMGGMMQGVGQPQPPQPPAQAIAQWHISISGQQAGPYTIDQLRQYVTSGQLTPTTYMWKSGMGGWEMASNISELASLFGAVPPPPPPMPPMPPAL